jgi:hypothetical protein
MRYRTLEEVENPKEFGFFLQGHTEEESNYVRGILEQIKKDLSKMYNIKFTKTLKPVSNKYGSEESTPPKETETKTEED